MPIDRQLPGVTIHLDAILLDGTEREERLDQDAAFDLEIEGDAIVLAANLTDLRRDGLDLASKEKPHEVDVVNPEIEECPTARSTTGFPRRERVGGCREDRTHRDDVSDRSVAYRRAHPLVQRVESVVEPHDSDATARTPALDETLGVPERRGNRLLEVEMLASGQRVDPDGSVEGRRERNDDGIDVGSRQELAVIGEPRGVGHESLAVGERLRTRVGEGDEARSRHRRQDG